MIDVLAIIPLSLLALAFGVVQYFKLCLEKRKTTATALVTREKTGWRIGYVLGATLLAYKIGANQSIEWPCVIISTSIGIQAGIQAGTLCWKDRH
jgi:hypothetical protein